ncbi:motility associated factor glycosyltransferase family protein [Shewanella algae]
MKLDEIKKYVKSLIFNNKSLYSSYDKGFYFGCSNFSKLRDKYKGKRAFVIGNGPSLNNHDLSLLKEEYTFAVNGIFYKTKSDGFVPTFYVVEDRHVMLDNLDEINDFNAKYKFFPVDYRSKIKNRKNCWFFRMDKGYYNKTSPYFAIPRFSTDMNDKLYCGQSVTMINLQIAYYLGFDEVYLIGMDHSYQIPSDANVSGEEITSNSDDPNHFHPAYFGKGKKWHDPHLDRVERTYSYFKLVYESQGRKIYNATVGGNLDVFERADYMSLFK